MTQKTDSLLRRLSSTHCIWAYLSGTFISNVGNGMFALIVSKALYDETGSVGAFGLVLVIQNVVTVLLNIVAGQRSDHTDPQRLSVGSNVVSGMLTLSAAVWCIWTPESLTVALMTLTAALSVVTPFFRAANFTLIPHLERGPLTLLTLNAVRSSLNQSGQLVGVALAAPLALLNSPLPALALSLAAFLLTALLMNLAHTVGSSTSASMHGHAATDGTVSIGRGTPHSPRGRIMTLYSDWFHILRDMLRRPSLLALPMLAVSDYVSVAFINLMEIKYATDMLGHAAYLSLLDGAFAAGAIGSFLLSKPVLSHWSFRTLAPWGMGLQAIAYALLATQHLAVTSAALMLTLGLVNGASIAVYQTALHTSFPDAQLGRISSLRDLLVSVATLATIAVFTGIVDANLHIGLWTFAAMLMTMSLICMAACHTRLFAKVTLDGASTRTQQGE